MRYNEEILAALILIILAGVLYLLNIFIFKSHMLRPEDMENGNYRCRNLTGDRCAKMDRRNALVRGSG